MQVREYAEQVLFGTTLEDKLLRIDHRVGQLEDSKPGQSIDTPAAPGRPAGLHMASRIGERVGFPGLHELDKPRARGTVFHFFANHELLALELMALALLKFVDAPAAFRRGLVRTIGEEQDHMRLYLERMEKSGVELGEIPVNGYFWNCSAAMVDPLDYVTQLSLTFEQANLDYCVHYSEAFRLIGDLPSAMILDRVCEDEIGHLKFGVQWFERLRDHRKGESEFEAYQRLLKPPLTPVRARGFAFNREARLEAGLSEEYVDAVRLFRTSRGRPPDVFCYFPDAEVLSSCATAQAQLCDDFTCHSLLLATADDLALVTRSPSRAFLNQLLKGGVAIPEVVSCSFATAVTRSLLEHRPLGALRPSLWSDGARQFLAGIAASEMPDDVERPSCESIVAECVAAGDADWVTRDREGSVMVCRLARQFLLDGRGEIVDYGLVRKFLDNEGCLLGTYAGKLTRALTPELARFVHGEGQQQRRLFTKSAQIGRAVCGKLHARGYVGPVEVESEIRRDPQGRLCYVPVVGTHLRSSTAHLSVALARRIAPGSQGLWLFFKLQDAAHSGFDSLTEFLAALCRSHPIQLADSRATQLVRGALPTSEPGPNSDWATCLIVGKTLTECAAAIAECSRFSAVLG